MQNNNNNALTPTWAPISCLYSAGSLLDALDTLGEQKQIEEGQCNQTSPIEMIKQKHRLVPELNQKSATTIKIRFD